MSEPNPTDNGRREPVHTFTFPESVRQSWKEKHGEDGPTTIGLVENNLERDALAIKRSQARRTPPSEEMVRIALVELDGAPLDDTEREQFFNKATRKMRELIADAWAVVNLPRQEETRDFLSSRQVVY
ncbi:MAG: hypothetical protein C4523_17715 [Myxococcales bacterium]|nr:MAG: hypothetical protein C4523_17715 [Myxococcales bacterium]